MNFGLTPEQEELQRSARRFLQAEWPPAAAHAVFAANHDGYPRELYGRMAQLGWMGVLAPREASGLGGSFLDAALLTEELGRAAVAGPYLANTLAVWALRQVGSGVAKHWLPLLASGQSIGTFAWFEGDSQTWPVALQTRLTLGRFGIRVHGVKRFVLDAHVADAMLVVGLVVSAGRRSTAVVVVPGSQQGIKIRTMDDVDRTRRIHEVEFDGVTVPRRSLIALGTSADRLLARVYDAAAVLLAADSLGGAQKLLEMTVEYAKVRQQFGRPIGSFQAIKHRCAEMVAQIEPARSLVWYAAHAIDALPRQAACAASLAKGHLSEVYVSVAESALRVHGGIGFTWEHDLHIWFKRAQWNRYAFGSPERHRERVAQELRW
ncbi:MAG: acyl-CoA dehydrogenase [Candidatus Binatia bacterium]|nr:MAG: acyl-CoA dehydrogenase [Candidatus Binatia bacterium]